MCDAQDRGARPCTMNDIDHVVTGGGVMHAYTPDEGDWSVWWEPLEGVTQ